jgi:hypothetical protein
MERGESEMPEGIGSPGWARTSDFLWINFLSALYSARQRMEPARSTATADYGVGELP